MHSPLKVFPLRFLLTFSFLFAPAFAMAGMNWGAISDLVNTPTIQTTLALGEIHTCAIQEGDLWCWGDNRYGQLGTGGWEGTYPKSPIPARVKGVKNAVSIVSGRFHTCAVTEGGDLYCWGINNFGQLGSGKISPGEYLPQKALINDVLQVAMGHRHTCALKRDKTVWCWGDYQHSISDKAHSASAPQPNPTQIAELSEVVEISIDHETNCARKADKTFWCWAPASPAGSAGGGIPSSPARIAGLDNFKKISANVSGTSACGISPEKTISCVDLRYKNIPENRVEIKDVEDFILTPYFSCAFDAMKQLWCWGEKFDDGNWILKPYPMNEVTREVKPAPYPGLNNVIEIGKGTATRGHLCIREEGGSILCWGGDFFGQVGNSDGNVSTVFNTLGEIIHIDSPIEVRFPVVKRLKNLPGRESEMREALPNFRRFE